MGDKHTEKLGADEAGIARAAALIEAGGLVALPTETVYGLADRADRAAAVAVSAPYAMPVPPVPLPGGQPSPTQ